MLELKMNRIFLGVLRTHGGHFGEIRVSNKCRLGMLFLSNICRLKVYQCCLKVFFLTYIVPGRQVFILTAGVTLFPVQEEVVDHLLLVVSEKTREREREREREIER